MDFIDELKWRGLIADVTNKEKLKQFVSQKQAAYIGFDPSFDSLHLGNYVMVLLLRRLAQYGHKAYALVGGATGLIGDPSGKKNERTLKPIEQINDNLEMIRNEIIKYGKCDVINNYDIYKSMHFLDFLREIGKHINVNYLLEKDIIKRRLETGISYTEFSYTLIQAYDFYWLYKNKDVFLQIGGEDQWGNITTGVEFINKNVENNNACGLTITLITKSDGTKFGKTEKGAIYLNSKYTSPHEMFQFFINQSDKDVEKLLKFMTFLPKDNIEDIMKIHKNNPKEHFAQHKLAQEVICDIHGENAYEICLNTSKSLFGKNLIDLKDDELFEALKHTNKFRANKHEYNIVDLIYESGLASSKSNARQLISSNAIIVNHKLINSIDVKICKDDAFNNHFSYIKKGKKDYCVIIWP